MRSTLGAGSVGLATALVLAAAQQPPAEAPPRSLDEFRTAAARVLEDTGVPGAAIALVRPGGIEWTGGLGWSDRDSRRPMDDDTFFPAGSLGKTFVAMALVQLYEDGRLDLDATVRSVLPDLAIENPWEPTDPVRIRHLLEHTAGFDDTHFDEAYVRAGADAPPLADVLRLHPASRRVRWRPGTRVAFSSPGYAVAARVIEVVAGVPFDQFIAERTFEPLAMTGTTFGPPPADVVMAQGYDVPGGPPVPRRRVLLRPADGLQSSARELGAFVEMLLAWGEHGGAYVVDPEYLSNMEWPRTTPASAAGVRTGYGLGIATTLDLPFVVLGHDARLEGFAETYAYSPSRDVGYAILLNASYAPDALRRLSSLALGYLKRGVEAPAAASRPASPEALGRYAGYYHEANPRQAVTEGLRFPMLGRTIAVDGGQLVMTPVFGAGERLVPIDEGLFRREPELAASLAFIETRDGMALAGGTTYAERRPRWPIDLLRGLLLLALCIVVASPFAAAGLLWRRRERRARWTSMAWLAAGGALGAAAWAAWTATPAELGFVGARSAAIYAG
ncbi:MAG: serine hydrolase domain-containing protein, partial [Vicinamibacterales bacterium]